MKYEAKDVSSVATSQAASTPWINISQATAITTCRALGAGYDLITNAQWMTIAANVAAIASNWTGGVVGTGYLFSGHNDNSPASACAASSNDALFYVESDCTAVSSGDTSEQRRTLTLSNGAVIWDFSDNVAEWVNYKNRSDKPAGDNSRYYDYHWDMSGRGTTSTPLKDLYPTYPVKSFWNDSWSSSQRIGTYFPGTNDTGGAMLRGGAYSHTTNAGAFSAMLSKAPTDTATDIGFRCVKTGP